MIWDNENKNIVTYISCNCLHMATKNPVAAFPHVLESMYNYLSGNSH